MIVILTNQDKNNKASVDFVELEIRDFRIDRQSMLLADLIIHVDEENGRFQVLKNREAGPNTGIYQIADLPSLLEPYLTKPTSLGKSLKKPGTHIL